jgi:hypothetical protein
MITFSQAAVEEAKFSKHLSTKEELAVSYMWPSSV